MTPAPITCDSELPDGSKCSERLAVTKTQYVYDRKPIVGVRDYTLREIHYYAMCPRCGERQYVEKHEA